MGKRTCISVVIYRPWNVKISNSGGITSSLSYFALYNGDRPHFLGCDPLMTNNRLTKFSSVTFEFYENGSFEIIIVSFAAHSTVFARNLSFFNVLTIEFELSLLFRLRNDYYFHRWYSADFFFTENKSIRFDRSVERKRWFDQLMLS